MMSQQPLDVVSLFSTTSLHLLNQEPPGVQELVVETITCCINQWEEKHVVLDPITREAVLDSLVIIHIAAAKGFAEMVVQARQEHNESCSR